MNWLKNKINFKVISFTLFLVLIGLIFIINSWLINSLRESVSKTAKSYQVFIQGITSDEALGDYSTIQLFKSFLTETDIPIIIKNIIPDEIYTKSFHFDGKSDEEIQRSLINMGQSFNSLPIKVIGNDGSEIISQKLYYGDTDMIKIIKLVPFIQILIVLFLTIIGFMYYSSSRKNLQNALYVGIFKETAHQLGTPISSLMGWSENIKSKGLNEDVIRYVDEDIQKLKDISERFSKIGSKVNLERIDLSNLLGEIAEYTKNRIPKTKNIRIVFNYKEGLHLKGDKMLLSWAFENLIKNSIQAIEENSGKIEIKVDQISSITLIYFEDTGKGIPRSDWKKIFSPGYSTKSRGWGVGLSLTQRIIEQIHSGKIYVSNSSKRGTSIQISI